MTLISLCGLLVFTATSHAAVYAGTAYTAGHATISSNFTTNTITNFNTSGTSQLQATIGGGTIQFAPTTIGILGQTFTGTSLVTSPITLQQTSVSYSITMNYSGVVVPASDAYALTSISGGLSYSGQAIPSPTTANLTLSGSYTLSAGGETVTGTFGHSAILNEYFVEGQLQVAGANSVTLNGGNYFVANAGSDPIPLINQTVDGIPLYFNLFSGDSFYAQVMPDDGVTKTTLTIIPEASSFGLAMLSGIALLRRRRN